MWIEPNTTIKICRNVPLDPTYDHTIWFASTTAQQDYFSSKAKYTLNQQTYQRVQRGYMRIYKRAEDLYDCNYLMFQNTAFGNKWFYAFIKGVEYVNNEVSQINFEIDVMQTWYFDYTLDQCFVEREHTDSDELFEHIIPENVDVGEDIVVHSASFRSLSDMNMILIYSQGQGIQSPQIVNKILMPLEYSAGLQIVDNNLTEIKNLLNSVIGEGQEDRIVNVYQFPQDLISYDDSGNFTYGSIIHTTNINTHDIDGYVPKNKKLFCYPYNFILVSNQQGATATFKYENWNNPENYSGRFEITGVPITTPSVMCFPTQYRGQPIDYESGITISNFPQIAWNGDTYERWWAQNGTSFTTSLVASTISGLAMAGIAFANPALGAASAGAQFAVKAGGIAALLNAGTSIANSVAKVNDLQNTPPQIHGQMSGDSLMTARGRFGFGFYNVTIKREYAKIVDDYFTRFGYACKLNKIPNTHVRENWTYTKTIGCTISGSIPADDASAICEIYNNGITFWTNGNNVGNYTLSNNPL